MIPKKANCTFKPSVKKIVFQHQQGFRQTIHTVVIDKIQPEGSENKNSLAKKRQCEEFNLSVSCESASL